MVELPEISVFTPFVFVLTKSATGVRVFVSVTESLEESGSRVPGSVLINWSVSEKSPLMKILHVLNHCLPHSVLIVRTILSRPLGSREWVLSNRTER